MSGDVVARLLDALRAPDDTIPMKPRWSKASGGSEQRFTDALRVSEVQACALAGAYLDEWALRL